MKLDTTIVQIIFSTSLIVIAAFGGYYFGSNNMAIATYKQGLDDAYVCNTSCDCKDPICNVTCPELPSKIIVNEQYSTGYTRGNNIQKYGYDLSTDYIGGDYIIHGIDEWGKLYGFSMQPTIFDGYTVIEKEYNNQTLHEGMIIRFIDNGKPIIHRIRGIYPDFVVTQGDSLPNEYEYINKSQITHIVVGVLFTNGGD